MKQSKRDPAEDTEQSGPEYRITMIRSPDLTEEERLRRIGQAYDIILGLGRNAAEAPGAAAPAASTHPLDPGLGLGFVQLEGARDASVLSCQLCGRKLGGTAWAKAVSDGQGGLTWVAPVCLRCRGREASTGRTALSSP